MSTWLSPSMLFSECPFTGDMGWITGYITSWTSLHFSVPRSRPLATHNPSETRQGHLSRLEGFLLLPRTRDWSYLFSVETKCHERNTDGRTRQPNGWISFIQYKGRGWRKLQLSLSTQGKSLCLVIAKWIYKDDCEWWVAWLESFPPLSPPHAFETGIVVEKPNTSVGTLSHNARN